MKSFATSAGTKSPKSNIIAIQHRYRGTVQTFNCNRKQSKYSSVTARLERKQPRVEYYVGCSD